MRWNWFVADSALTSQETHLVRRERSPLYASVTDYAAVYNDVYRDRRGAHTSFNIDILPTLLASFCRAAGVTSLLDVSGGQGRLIESLGRLGIRGLTTDICPSPGQPIITFDLSRYSETDIARIRQEMERVGDGLPHLTCCLDVLEHIDREHVFAAMRNLANLSAAPARRLHFRRGRVRGTICSTPRFSRSKLGSACSRPRAFE